jgi:hypothetical protein
MFLMPRDLQVVRAIAHFGHLEAGHLRYMFFHENKSDTPADRTFQRLTERGYIYVLGITRRSRQNIYALDELGKKLFSSDTYKKAKASDIEHTIAIADTFIALMELERAGGYKIVNYETEPSNWHMLAGVKLRSDLYVELGDKARGKLLSWWLEVDLDHQGHVVITDKLNRYYHAWKHVRDEDFPLPTMPRVVFLVPSERRAARIRALIGQQPEEAHHLFDVKLRADFPQAML